MAAPSAQGPPGPDEDPARRPDEPGGDPSPDERVDWRPGEMSEEDREAWLDGLAADPGGHGRSGPRHGDRRTTGDHRGAGHDRRLVRATRPGQPGSAHRFPGESSSRAAAFATGLVLDVTPGCPELPDSPTRPPGRMIPSAAPPMMSSWGYRAPGTGWRRTPRRASDNDTGCLSGCCPENGLDGRASSYARRVIPGTGSKSRSGVLENPVLV